METKNRVILGKFMTGLTPQQKTGFEDALRIFKDLREIEKATPGLEFTDNNMGSRTTALDLGPCLDTEIVVDGDPIGIGLSYWHQAGDFVEVTFDFRWSPDSVPLAGIQYGQRRMAAYKYLIGFDPSDLDAEYSFGCTLHQEGAQIYIDMFFECDI